LIKDVCKEGEGHQTAEMVIAAHAHICTDMHLLLAKTVLLVQPVP